MIIQMIINISILLLQGQHSDGEACCFLFRVTFLFTVLNIHSTDGYGFWPHTLSCI